MRKGYFRKILTLEAFESSEENRKNFWNSSRLLMNFLFSFVFGFGLTRLHEAVANPKAIEILKLFIAYITVFQAWIGYNWVAYLKNEYEKQNALNFTLDIGSTFLYWGLIESYNKAIWSFLFFFVLLFGLYVIWALIKYLSDKKRYCRRRLYLNILFSVLFLLLYAINIFLLPGADLLLSLCAMVLIIMFRIIRLFPFFAHKSLC